MDSWADLGKSEYAVDLLCEEIANFSFYQESYRSYLLNFVHGNCSDVSIVNRVKALIDFPQIDELLTMYTALENAYLQANFLKGFTQDNKQFIELIKKGEQQ